MNCKILSQVREYQNLLSIKEQLKVYFYKKNIKFIEILFFLLYKIFLLH